MRLPKLTKDDIEQNCSERSFERGERYHQDGAIGNPVRYGYTLSAACEGTGSRPYRVRVFLMPTGIADAHCSCPYSGKGYCKHIVALLLTYVFSPEVVTAIETVLTCLETQPKSHLITVVSELLRRAPQLVPVAQFYAEMPVLARKNESSPQAVIMQQIDSIFGAGFLSHEQVHTVLEKLTRLKTHATALAQEGENEFASSIFTALVAKCIERYEDTPKGKEVPRFLTGCTEVFATVIADVKERPAWLQQQLLRLLNLSFSAESVFTETLTEFLAKVSRVEDGPMLEPIIQKQLHQSPNRQAHVRLLLSLYETANRVEDYLAISHREGEDYLFISKLFELKKFDLAFRWLRKSPLSADEYWKLMQMEVGRNPPDFEKSLLAAAEAAHPVAVVELYQRLIDIALVLQKRSAYHRVRGYLLTLRELYKKRGLGKQWRKFLNDFLKHHSRKRALLEIIADVQP